jgi:hypothetical protein
MTSKLPPLGDLEHELLTILWASLVAKDYF